MTPPPADAPERIDLAIIGGGIAGLSAAWAARQRDPGCVVRVFEATARPGGKILTETITTDAGDFLVEGGPDAFATHKPWGLDLVTAFGLNAQLRPIPSGNGSVAILKAGAVVPLPDGLSLLAPTKTLPFLRSPLLSARGKARVLAEPFVKPNAPDGDESLASFVARRFGREAIDWIAEPLLAGIYNADPARLSMRAAFPAFAEMERSGKSVLRASKAARRTFIPRKPALMTLSGGMQGFIDALVARLDGVIACNAPVTTLTTSGSGYLLQLGDGRTVQAATVIVALPPTAAADVVRAIAPDAADRLATIRSANAGTIMLAYRRAEIGRPLPGYALVIAGKEDRPLNAITDVGRKVPGRAPAGWTLIRAFFGGSRSPESVALDDAAVTAMVRGQLAELLGIQAEPHFTRIYRWPAGSPQYDVGHHATIAAIERDLPAGLRLIGGAYRGVGIPDIIRTGALAAEALVVTER